MGNKINSIINVKGYQILIVILEIISILNLLFLSTNINNIVTLVQNGNEIVQTEFIKVFIGLIIFICMYFILPILYKILFLKARKNMQMYLFNEMINFDYSFFETNDNGYILNIIFDIAYDVSSYYSGFWIKFIVNSLSLIGYFVLIFYYSWTLGIIIILLLLITIVLTNVIVSKQAKAYSEGKAGQARMNTFFLDIVDNIFIVKSINNESKYFQNKFADVYKKNSYQPIKKMKILEALYNSFYAVILYVLPLVILIIGILFNDFFKISIGATISVYTIFGNLQEPIRQFAAFNSDRKNNNENLEVLIPFFENENNTKKEFDSNFENISFESKGIKYKDQDKVLLKDVNFTLNNGDFALLKGKSGIGKSTIFKILSGYNKFEGINLKFNGKDFYEYDLHKTIMIVPQKSCLFEDSLINNICCGENFSDDQINEIIKVCMLKEYTDSYGLNSMINSLHSNISGGEMQRINLARILIRKPKVVLLDEISSALDINTKQKLIRNIYEYTKRNQITVLTISHDSEFDSYANKIIDLNKEVNGGWKS